MIHLDYHLNVPYVRMACAIVHAFGSDYVANIIYSYELLALINWL